MNVRYTQLLATFLIIVAAGIGCAGSRTKPPSRDAAPATAPPEAKRRPLRLVSGDRWIGNGVAYGPHRDRQFPGGPGPSREELAEDLRIMLGSWNLIRVYGAVGPSETLLDIIRAEELDIRVMLGVWIAPEARRDESGAVVEKLAESKAANRREVESAIRLAVAYPDIVIALCVGNETQVFWSSHRVAPDILIQYVREVRAGTTLPVTVADDFNFWNKPESRSVAEEIDFIVMHAHPMWNGLSLEDALDWTRGTYADIRAAHRDHIVVLGETGWATRKHSVGEQATLIKGHPGEREQKVFYDSFQEWVTREQIPSFFFEAFDENWKGGDHPDEVEKHWGLYRADRTPKAAMAAAE